MKHRLIVTPALLASCALATPAMAEPDYAAAVRSDYRGSLGALFDHFHRNPELSYKEGGAPVPSHHSPLFKIEPEPAIVAGTVAMTAAVLDLLSPQAAAGANSMTATGGRK